MLSFPLHHRARFGIGITFLLFFIFIFNDKTFSDLIES
jgi:hypothetical protein